MRQANPVLVTLATLSLVLLGVTVNLLTAFFPLVLWMFQRPIASWYYVLPIILAVQGVHLYLLWTDPKHVAAYRFLTLPLRRVIQPIVMYMIKADTIKDQLAVAYLDLPNDLKKGKDEILKSLRPSVRRRHNKCIQSLHEHGIRVDSVQCETSLDLRAVVPILWEHQKRQLLSAPREAASNANQEKKKNLVEEFIKRFLVVSLVPYGVLDLFYNNDTDELVALQMGIRHGTNYHWFMYFAKDEARHCGIWFAGILMSIIRARSIRGIETVSGLTGHMESKQNAGFTVCNYDSENYNEIIERLFPSVGNKPIPDKALPISLHDSVDDDQASQKRVDKKN